MFALSDKKNFFTVHALGKVFSKKSLLDKQVKSLSRPDKSLCFYIKFREHTPINILRTFIRFET